MSLAKAQEMLTKKELAEFRWTLDEYIKYGEANACSQKYLRELENASARSHITRMQELELSVQHEVQKVFEKYDADTADLLRGHYKSAYDDAAGALKTVSGFDKRKLEMVLSKPWTADGVTFSSRIWQDQARLTSELHKTLIRMCITGETPDTAVAEIAKTMGVTLNRAKALVTTESTRIAAVASKDAYSDAGVEHYEILAEVDDKTSDICLEMDGKVFKMSEFEEGVTAPPFHVNCRSIIAGYFPELDSERGKEDNQVIGMKRLQNRYVYADPVTRQKMFIPKGTDIDRVVTIYEGDQIRDISRLIKRYGGSAKNWVKNTGQINSDRYMFDMHWYECFGIQYEMKHKVRKDK